MAVVTTATDKHLYATSGNLGSTTSAFSLCTWVNVNWGVATTISMIGLYNGSATVTPTVGLQMGLRASTGAFSCWRYGGTVMVTTATNAMTPYNDTWVHIVYTYDGTTHTIYVNGIQNTTATTAQTAGAFTQLWVNGYPPSSASETAVYSLENIRFYNRTLTANEVLTIYSSAGSRDGIILNLGSNYELNNGGQGSIVSSVPDLTGSSIPLISYGTGTDFTYMYTGVYPTSNKRISI